MLIIEPASETITVHDAAIRVYRPGETLTHPALPGFALDLAALFARARR